MGLIEINDDETMLAILSEYVCVKQGYAGVVTLEMNRSTFIDLTKQPEILSLLDFTVYKKITSSFMACLSGIPVYMENQLEDGEINVALGDLG